MLEVLYRILLSAVVELARLLDKPDPRRCRRCARGIMGHSSAPTHNEEAS